MNPLQQSSAPSSVGPAVHTPDAPAPAAVFKKLLTDWLAGATLKSLLGKTHRPCRWLMPLHDFCQDVVTQAMGCAAEFRGTNQAQLLAWLLAIGRHKAALLWRSRRLAEDPLPENWPGREGSPLEVLIGEEDRRGLEKALAELPAPDQHLLQLHYEDAQTFVQIAPKLGKHKKWLARRHRWLVAKFRQAQEFRE